jgi:hypothetical protein
LVESAGKLSTSVARALRIQARVQSGARRFAAGEAHHIAVTLVLIGGAGEVCVVLGRAAGCRRLARKLFRLRFAGMLLL